jgi:hypothetical protein
MKMTRIYILIAAAGLLSSCGMVPPGSPEKAIEKSVTTEKTSKTITVNRDIIFPGSPGKYVQVPKGTYSHVATGSGYLYFQAPKAPVYLVDSQNGREKRAMPGGIAISKSMLKACYIYIDGEPGKKMWTRMLGMEFISAEGTDWKRNYDPAVF